MRLKTLLFTILGILIISLMNCGDLNLSKAPQRPAHFDHGRDLIAHLDHNLSLLKNLDTNNDDFKETVVLINEQIRKTIERIKTKKLLKEVHKSYSALGHDFTFTMSKDGKVGIFSWDSMVKGAFHNIRNIALYVKKDKIIPTSLYGDPLVYHQIHTIKTATRSVYLLQGQGDSKKSGDFFRMDAYTINSNGMEQAKIFPNRQSSMVSFLDFNIEMDGSLILKPELWGDKIAYRPLELHINIDDVNYAEAATSIAQKLGSKEFEIDSANGFLKGSEMPIVISGTQDQSLVFEDGLKVNVSHNPEETNSLTLLTLPKAENIELSWDGKTKIVAKKDGFLFFSEEAGPSNNNLHLYDIDAKSIRWTRPLTKAYLLDDAILFAEKTESYLVSNSHEIRCGSSVGANRAYYKIYSVRYREKHPIVEFTHQLFCGSSPNTHVAKL